MFNKHKYDSDFDTGSPTVVSLPARSSPSASTHNPDSGFRNSAHGKTASNAPRYLLVDDNESCMRLMVAMLSTQSCSLTCAADGREAIDKLKTNRFDVVILDYHMPNATGADVLIWMNDNMETHPRVIMHSSDDDRATIRLFKTLGADAVMTKPVQPSEFLMMVAAQQRA